MPRRRSAIKSLRINRQHQMHNLDMKTDLRKTIKKLQSFIRLKKIEEAKAALRVAYKKIDKATKRNIFHKNTAARRKSQLTRLLTAATKK